MTIADFLKNRYIAHLKTGGVQKSKQFSIPRLGKSGAKLAASLQRMVWLIEFKIWNPENGDPFEILSYAESFSRNSEYENAVVSDVSSPWKSEFHKD